MEVSEHLETIFANMCRIVGANYHEIDRTKENWYTEHTWDIETEKIFSKWMEHYIHKMPGASQEIYGKSRMSKKDCILATQLFLLSYGWKTIRE